MPRAAEDLLRRLYAAFNARDVETVVASMHPDVDWPNAFEGGRVHGRDAVLAYWRHQFALIDPIVTPERFTTLDDGRIAVDVHQVIRATRRRASAPRGRRSLLALGAQFARDSRRRSA